MPVPPKQSIQHYRGDTLTIQITCWKDTAKTDPVVFNGAVITSQLRVKIDSPTPADSFDVNVTDNTVTLLLTPTKVTALPASTVWDVQVDWDGDGANIQTIAQGTLALDPDITHA